MKKLLAMTLVVAMALAAIGCSTTPAAPATEAAATEAPATEAQPAEGATDTEAATEPEAEQKFVVGFSQGTMNHPFRVAMVDENIAYAKENYPDMEIIATDGNNESSKQVQDVEDLLARGIDLLIISPLTAEALTDVCQKAIDQGIPVVTLDRNVNCDVTCFVGAENYPMGVAAAKLLSKMMNEKGTVIEIQGTAGASATIDRHDGFAEELKNHPDVKVIADQYCDYLREPAMTYMEDMLQRFGPGEISAIYTHNDEMALGALEAIKSAGRQDEGILIVGMDGTEVAFDAIKAGEMAFTVVYPYCAPEGVQVAHDILTGKTVEPRLQLDTAIVSAENIDEWIGKGL